MVFRVVAFQPQSCPCNSGGQAPHKRLPCLALVMPGFPFSCYPRLYHLESASRHSVIIFYLVVQVKGIHGLYTPAGWSWAHPRLLTWWTRVLSSALTASQSMVGLGSSGLLPGGGLLKAACSAAMCHISHRYWSRHDLTHNGLFCFAACSWQPVGKCLHCSHLPHESSALRQPPSGKTQSWFAACRWQPLKKCSHCSCLPHHSSPLEQPPNLYHAVLICCLQMAAALEVLALPFPTSVMNTEAATKLQYAAVTIHSCSSC